MKPPILKQTENSSTDSSKSILFFSVGRMDFGVEAASVGIITGKDWVPPEGGWKFEMGKILGFDFSGGARTLVVHFPDFSCGFVVDSIFSQGISHLNILPASPLLKSWMNPSLLSGFCTINHRLIGILDLRILADYALSHNDSPTPKH